MSAIEAQAIEFQIAASTEPERLATCAFSVQLDGEPIWPVLGEIATLEIQADDLLAHLVEFWKPLLLRQIYPSPFNPARPSLLRGIASERWAENPPETADREDEAVTAFEEAHDLARAFGGLFDLPSFWLLRSGNRFVCETQGRLWHLPCGVVAACLGSAGDAIADMLSVAGEKWADLIAAWKARDEGDGISLLAWSASLDLETSKALVDQGLLEPPATIADAVNDNDELRIAARLAGALPTELLTNILALARTFEWHEANPLATLANDCRDYIEERFGSRPPYVQGEATARKAREWLGASMNDHIDVFDVVRELGAELCAEAVEPDVLDGLAIWGDRFGPGMFLNLASERVAASDAQSLEADPAARVTAAHELCHLLLDGAHAVSAVDVLMSRMPVGVEQRAKSFAGEFLLPSRTAARYWQEMGGPQDRERLDDVLVRLAGDFGVPRAVASWKLDHGLQFRGIDLSVQLDSLARWR
jgi:hypothetical protein